MKKLFIYSLLFIAVCASSCKKYLDVKPLGKVIPTTYEDYSNELNDAYNIYSTLVNKALCAYRSDEVTSKDSRFGEIRNQYTWDENNTEVNKPLFVWRSPYQIIFYTNHVIKNIDAATTGTHMEQRQLKGEAYLLRAAMYFDLVTIFGNAYNEGTAAADKAVPLITHIDMENVSPRNSVKEVYAQIVKDIEDGSALLNRNTFSVDSSFKFTTVAASALAARVNLYRKDWQKTVAFAKAVLAQNGTLINLNDTKVLPNLYNAAETIQAGAFTFNSSMLGYFFVSNDLIQKYDRANDLRFNLYYKYAASGTTVLKSGSNKFACTFRTAEQYLNLAEAYAQLKNETEAKNYLNQLKKNRLTPTFYTAEEARVNQLSGAGLLSEIYDERARELAFEGHRWFDLRRTTQPSIIHKVKVNNTDMTYTLAQGDARYTATIPLEAIKANPKLAE